MSSLAPSSKCQSASLSFRLRHSVGAGVCSRWIEVGVLKRSFRRHNRGRALGICRLMFLVVKIALRTRQNKDRARVTGEV